MDLLYCPREFFISRLAKKQPLLVKLGSYRWRAIFGPFWKHTSSVFCLYLYKLAPSLWRRATQPPIIVQCTHTHSPGCHVYSLEVIHHVGLRLLLVGGVFLLTAGETTTACFVVDLPRWCAVLAHLNKYTRGICLLGLIYVFLLKAGRQTPLVSVFDFPSTGCHV